VRLGEEQPCLNAKWFCDRLALRARFNTHAEVVVVIYRMQPLITSSDDNDMTRAGRVVLLCSTDRDCACRPYDARVALIKRDASYNREVITLPATIFPLRKF